MPITEIRLFPDWGHRWSLWRVGSIAPGALGLSETLAADLAEWTRIWQEELDPVFEVKWETEEAGWRWIQRGHELATRLQAELGEGFIVRSRFDQYAPPGCVSP